MLTNLLRLEMNFRKGKRTVNSIFIDKRVECDSGEKSEKKKRKQQERMNETRYRKIDKEYPQLIS